MERLADLPVPLTQQTLKCHYWQQDMTAGCSSLTVAAPAPNFCFNWFRFPPRQFPCRTAEIFSFFSLLEFCEPSRAPKLHTPDWFYCGLSSRLGITADVRASQTLFSAGMRILPLSPFLSPQFHHSFGWEVAAAVFSRQWLLCLK